MHKHAIETPAAPAAIGAYSQAVKAGNLVFLSGQIPLVPGTSEFAGDDIRTQVTQVFDNLQAVASAAGGTLDQAVRLTVYLTDLAHFPVVNEVMSQVFAAPYPARATVQVSALPRGALVEVDAILSL
ncbi:MAG: Rid family detoxifying hydrolase [Gammaproteobacteria bacterium]